jgi:hypothetical protein
MLLKPVVETSSITPASSEGGNSFDTWCLPSTRAAHISSPYSVVFQLLLSHCHQDILVEDFVTSNIPSDTMRHSHVCFKWSNTCTLFPIFATFVSPIITMPYGDYVTYACISVRSTIPFSHCMSSRMYVKVCYYVDIAA